MNSLMLVFTAETHDCRDAGDRAMDGAIAERTQRFKIFKGRSDQVCHSRESGNPVFAESVGYWIPVFAGMTCSDVPKTCYIIDEWRIEVFAGNLHSPGPLINRV
jgi:hypothetical protein